MDARTGTHIYPDYATGDTVICDCGPANVYTGPQYAVVDGVEYRTATRISA